MEKNRFVRLRNAIVAEAVRQYAAKEVTKFEPCLTAIASEGVDTNIKAAIDHLKDHAEEDLTSSLHNLDPKQIREILEYMERVDPKTATGEDAPPVIQKLLNGSTDAMINAGEILVMFQLLPMLAATDDEEAWKVTSKRPYYRTAQKLLTEMLTEYFPKLESPDLARPDAAPEPDIHDLQQMTASFIKQLDDMLKGRKE